MSERKNATLRNPQGPSAQRTVAVPLYALVGAAVAGVAALLAIAFFLGRESARPTAAPAAEKQAASLDTAGQTIADPESEAPEAWDDTPEGGPADFETLFPPELNTESDPGEPAAATLPQSPAASAAGDAAVTRYFRELDSVEREAKYWSNPQDLAMTLLGQVTSGDTSGFDRLVVSQRRARDQVRGIGPPPPCAEHHRRVLSLMDRGVTLLESVRDAALAGDAGGLMALPTQAQQLETEAREVDALGAQIRSRYGVAN